MASSQSLKGWRPHEQKCKAHFGHPKFFVGQSYHAKCTWIFGSSKKVAQKVPEIDPRCFYNILDISKNRGFSPKMDGENFMVPTLFFNG